MQDSLPAGGLRLYREGVEPSGPLRKVSGHISLLPSRTCPVASGICSKSYAKDTQNNKCYGSGWPRLDRVVPFRMELIAGDVEALHRGIADFDALLIAARVERAFDLEPGVGGGCADQLDHGKTIRERSAAPVLRDVAEEAVLDPVPLRCAWRIVMDVDRKPGLVGELLQFEFPEPHARPVRAAAVRRDRQFSRLRIALPSHAFEPAADRRHGKLGGVAGDPDADEAGIGGHIIHPIRHDLAELLVLEVVHVHAPRIAFRTIVGSAVLEVAEQLLLLRIDGDDGLLAGLRRNDFRVDVFELGVAVGMVRAFIRLAIGLAREPELRQLRADRIGADRMSHLGQCRGELRHAFRYPDQGPHGIAQCRRFDQPLERRDEPRVGFRYRPTPASGTANPPLRKRLAVEVVFAAIDRRTSKPGNLRDQRETAATGAPDLRRRKQPPTTLVKPRPDRLPSQPNRRLVDHAIELRLFATSRNPQHLSHSDARRPVAIQLLSEVTLGYVGAVIAG